MRKLTLVVEELAVESFEPAGEEFWKGTVLGNDATDGPRCTAGTLQCGTCEVSCNYTACPADCDTDQGPSDIETCAYTCDVCSPTQNEAVSCQIAC